MLVMRAKCVPKFQFHEKKLYFLFLREIKIRIFLSHFVQSFIISYRCFNLLCMRLILYANLSLPLKIHADFCKFQISYQVHFEILKFCCFYLSTSTLKFLCVLKCRSAQPAWVKLLTQAAWAVLPQVKFSTLCIRPPTTNCICCSHVYFVSTSKTLAELLKLKKIIKMRKENNKYGSCCDYFFFYYNNT